MSNEPEKQMTAVDAALKADELAQRGGNGLFDEHILDEISEALGFDVFEDEEAEKKTFHILASEVRRLREENDKLRELTQWRPIETAPKDESILIMSKICESTFGIEEGFVDSETGNIESSVTGDGIVGASHWLPLPAAPESEVRCE